MEYVVCSVRDAKAEIFGQPIFTGKIGTVARSFADEVNRNAADNPYFRHPSDYTLYQLGTFNDETGQFTNLETPRLILIGNEAKEPATAHISKV